MSQNTGIKIVAVLFFTVIILSLFVGIAMAGGSKQPEMGSTPSHRKPKSSAVVYAPKGEWNVKGEADFKQVKGSTWKKVGAVWEWDLKGAILDGKNQNGKCDDKESNEPIFRAGIPLVVKNGFVRNGKNAMTFSKKGSGIERMTWLNVCEDAVATNKGAENFRVVDSEFMNLRNGDKSIQLNEAKGAVVKGNVIYGGTTCMRIGDSDTTSIDDVASVSGNKFIACDTAIHASKITVKVSGNTFTRVNTQQKSANGAKFK